MASLLCIPSDVRFEILRQLLKDCKNIIFDAAQKWGESSGPKTCEITTPYHILYTCRQLYAEARPILASQLVLKFCQATPADVPVATRNYYVPLIQKLVIDYSCEDRFGRLNGFSSLREVKFLHKASPDRFNKYDLNRSISEAAALSLVNGAMDLELMEMGRDTVMTRGSSWQKRILLLSKNGSAFKVLEHLTVDWYTPPHEDQYEEGTLVSPMTSHPSENCFANLGLTTIFHRGYSST